MEISCSLQGKSRVSDRLHFADPHQVPCLLSSGGRPIVHPFLLAQNPLKACCQMISVSGSVDACTKMAIISAQSLHLTDALFCNDQPLRLSTAFLKTPHQQNTPQFHHGHARQQLADDEQHFLLQVPPAAELNVGC